MTNNREIRQSDSTNDTQTEQQTRRSPSFMRWIMIGLGALGGLVVVAFILAIVLALTGDAGVASAFSVIRDVFIIILAVQGTLICIALIVLVGQISALINLLSSEVKPIIDETRDTISTARGTAEFMTKNLAYPVIRTSSTLVGVGVFIRELLAIRRNTRGQ
jgi:hypothetical protein